MPEELPEDCDETPDDSDALAEVIDLESQKRLWVRTLIPLLELRSHDSDPSDRVQLAVDLLHVAACERISRIVRSDLPGDAAGC
jgi:hypothetical protein